MDAHDLALLLLRAVLGVVMIAHGWNHWKGGGKITGTAGWFEGLGLRPPLLHAWSSVVVELAGGLALLLGLLTPLACAATVGVMTVAGITAHRKNGFFVFKEGYEYVLLIGVACVALGLLGPGSASLDSALGIADDLDGSVGGLLALVGVVGAALMLAACWRPQTKASVDA